MFVLGVDELVPRLLGVLSEDVVVVRVQCHVVLVYVRVQLIRAQHLRDLNQLVIVVLALEERLFLKDHAREHAPERPHVQ